MDMQMPIVDGITATRMLRSVGYSRPIVALTANVMTEDVARYRACGCDHVLAKPIDRAVFYDTILKQLCPAGDRALAVDDADLERELMAMRREFEAGLPARAEAVRTALRARDWASLTSQAHTLKGMAGSFGHGRLTELAGQVEASLRAGDFESAAIRSRSLLMEISRAIDPIRSTAGAAR
jgi:CheY-like chemotaxis protein